MKRLAILAILLVPLACMGSTPTEVLTKRYLEFNGNILKSDGKAMTAWVNKYCSRAFTYTSFQKRKFTRDIFLGGILQQFQETNKVLKSDLTIRGIEKKGRVLVATVAADFKGIVIIDSRKLTITDKSVTLETWSWIDRDWKLQKVVQVNADTQMQQDEGN